MAIAATVTARIVAVAVMGVDAKVVAVVIAMGVFLVVSLHGGGCRGGNSN